MQRQPGWYFYCRSDIRFPAQRINDPVDARYQFILAIALSRRTCNAPVYESLTTRSEYAPQRVIVLRALVISMARAVLNVCQSLSENSTFRLRAERAVSPLTPNHAMTFLELPLAGSLN